MSIEARKYFRYLGLVREDIRQEFDLLRIHPKHWRICDFGCGNGITTFALALEARGSKCIGVDLFTEDHKITPNKVDQLIKSVRNQCKQQKHHFSEICELIQTDRITTFRQANIVKNIALPSELHLAFCKKLLLNMYGKTYHGIEPGEKALLNGLHNISKCLSPNGQLCLIEYDNSFTIEEYWRQCGFRIISEKSIKRKEIRFKGRIGVISSFKLILCQKSTQL